MATTAPAPSSFSEMALPIPWLPPVTRAILSFGMMSATTSDFGLRISDLGPKLPQSEIRNPKSEMRLVFGLMLQPAGPNGGGEFVQQRDAVFPTDTRIRDALTVNQLFT